MRTCQNCGDTRQEKYCPNCGEKQYHAKALSIKHLAEETFESISHFDNKFFKSIGTLLMRPGMLTYYFCKGVTVRFMKPFPLFLVANLIFFLLPGQNPFSLPLYNYVNYAPLTTWGKTHIAVKEKIRETRLTEKEIADPFNERIRSASKVFIALFIPFFAGVFALIFYSSRKRFGEHLVFFTHFFTFLVCLYVIQAAVLAVLPIRYDAGMSDTVITLIDYLILSVYFSMAVRRLYAKPWWQAVLSSIFMAGLLLVTVQGYRIFLFYYVLKGI